MCLIFFALQHHPVYKLVVAANRDEFYQRRTAPSAFWHEQPNIVGGKDLEAMRADGSNGTWMAMNKNGRLAMITNYRDPQHINPKAPSRGYLVTDFLVGNEPAMHYLKKIQTSGIQYNGYNLLVGNANELWYLSNYQNSIQRLSNGVYGLSNHLLDTPWPKVANGKRRFLDLMQSKHLQASELFEFLFNSERAPDNELPDTGIGLEKERLLSSMFIKSNGYGTRSSTVVLVKHTGEVNYTERLYDLNTFDFKDATFQFQLN
jgi:uncharacterized protein with NRDE domain